MDRNANGGNRQGWEMTVKGRDVAAGRRRFVSLAAIVVVVLVAIVVIALYGMYSIDRTVVRNQVEIDSVTEIADHARIAQVGFKTEIQEWKNTLLRGHDPDDFTTYHDALLARQKGVDEDLAALEIDAAEVGFEADSIVALRAAHAELGKAYDAALALFAADDPLSVRAVDAAVRGKDRPINDGFDALVTEVKEFADKRRGSLRDEVAGVSDRMRIILYLSLGIGVVVLALAAFTAMRRDRPA
jgi:methyl-accepting chemotaxis protein-1 (serine sensor receptor)